MGATCSGQAKAFSVGSSSYPVKILLLGSKGVGKTHLLNRWLKKEETDEEIEPTQHFNVGIITTSSGLVFMIYDLAGNIGHRIRPFLDGTEGVVFMFGKSEEMTDDESTMVLQLSKERDLVKAPFLFVLQNEAYSSGMEKLQMWFEERPWDTIVTSSAKESQLSANMVLEALEALVKKHILIR